MNSVRSTGVINAITKLHIEDMIHVLQILTNSNIEERTGHKGNSHDVSITTAAADKKYMKNSSLS